MVPKIVSDTRPVQIAKRPTVSSKFEVQIHLHRYFMMKFSSESLLSDSSFKILHLIEANK